MLTFFLFAWGFAGGSTMMSTAMTVDEQYYYSKKLHVLNTSLHLTLRALAIFILWPYFAASESFAVSFLTQTKYSPFFERPNLN